MEKKEEIVKRVKDIVKSNLRFSDSKDFDDDTNIFEGRLLSSLVLMKMLKDLESGLGIDYELDTHNLNSFTSMNKIIDTVLENVERKHGK